MKYPPTRPPESLVAPAGAHRDEPACVWIRGVRLELDGLLDPRLADPSHLDGLRDKMKAAEPFPHLLVNGWFDPRLLELVREEFDVLNRDDWKTEFNQHARVERSRVDAASLGPASRLYFATLGSSRFLNLLSHISGVGDLVYDPHLVGGGLHETLPGGSFGIHTDFDRHPRTALSNEMVFITYLNKSWQPEWNGALELWDAEQKACAAKIEPEFGCSVLMSHGPKHFHGHSAPLTPPPEVTRRSVAAYFYANRFAREDRREAMLSKFLFTDRSERHKAFAKLFLPPILVGAVKRISRR